MYKINNTLLNKLFVSPAPMGGDSEILKIYNGLFSRMFPGKKLFIDYLAAQNVDIQYEKAEMIIHRLCYESNFPPSFFAIKDIECVEEFYKRKIGENNVYIPRDHFLHIVNLYMLGIYMFFYNTEFHGRIIKANRNRRKIVHDGQFAIGCYKDFISEWKYFCLYHDVGYVQELFSGMIFDDDESSKMYELLKKEENGFSDSYSKNQMMRHNAFFGSIELLSSIITLKFIDNNSNVLCDGDDDLFKFFKSSDISSLDCNEVSFDTTCKPLMEGLYILDRVYSNQCIKRILPLVGEENIAIVGIHQESGKVSFISLPDSGKRSLFYLSEISENEEMRSFLQDPSLILFDDFSSSGFELIYLFNKKSYMSNNAVLDFYGDYLLNQTYEYCIEQGCGLEFASVSNEEQLLDFFFYIYIVLYKAISKYKSFVPSSKRKDKYEMETFKILDSISDIVTSAHDRKGWEAIMSKHIKKCLWQDSTELIKEKCSEYLNKHLAPNTKDIDAQNTNSFVSEYYKRYFDNIEYEKANKNLIDDMSSEIGILVDRQISKVESVLLVYAVGYKALRYIYMKSLKTKNRYWFDYSKLLASYDSKYLQSYMPQVIGGKEMRIEKFMELYIHNLTKDNCEWKEKYANAKGEMERSKAKSRIRANCDHGFESAKYAGSVFELLQSSLNWAFANNQEPLLCAQFSISHGEKYSDTLLHYTEDYNHIFSNVLYSIVIHNIWPSLFTPKDGVKLVTSIEENPFAYFALLCDALQQWNRPQVISLSLEGARPNRAASEEYDIEIMGNKIYVYESKGSEMQKRLNDSINGLSYLRNVHALVKNGYSI